MGVLGGLILKAVSGGLLLNDLENYYNFEEASGSLIDQHGSNDATNSGSLTYSQAGKVNDAILFNTSGYFTQDSLIDLATTDFSISFWVKVTGGATGQMFIDFRDISSDGFYIRQVSSNLRMKWNGINHQTTKTTNDGNWHNIVWVVDRNTDTAVIYFDNTVALNHSVSGDLNVTTRNLRFGSQVVPSPGVYLTGLMDEVAIWKRVITVEEVATLWNSGNGITYTDF